MTDKGETDDKKTIMQWFGNLIERFRDEYNRLGELEREHIANPFDYRHPTQIEVFWISEPLENQIILTLHDRERKDKEVIVHGPYTGSELLDHIGGQMNEPRWAKEVLRENHLTVLRTGTKYSDIFATILHNFLDSISNSVFDKVVHGYKGGVSFPPNGWCWWVCGNVAYLDTNKILEGFLNVTRLIAGGTRETRRQQPSVVQPPRRLRGYGTHFYPPIWVGRAPVRTFKEIASGISVRRSSKVFDSKIDGANIIANLDGFMGVTTDSKQEALRTLNVIFGIAMVSGISCYAVRESEITEIEVESSALAISSYSWISSSARTLLHEQPRPVNVFRSGREIEQGEIERIVRTAGVIVKDRNLTEELLFLLEGYTHYQSSEYSQSFIMNWLILEKHISRLWRELLSKAEVEKNRIRKLTNPNFWSIDNMLETLNISGRLSPEDYELLMELKNKRNNLVHSGKMIDDQSARVLLEMGSKIVKHHLSVFLKP